MTSITFLFHPPTFHARRLFLPTRPLFPMNLLSRVCIFSLSSSSISSGKNADERPTSHESTNSAASSKGREIIVIDDDDDDDDDVIEVERVHVHHVGPAEMEPKYSAGTTDFTQAHCCRSGESEPLFPLFSAWLGRAKKLAENNDTVVPLHPAERKKCNDLAGRPTAPWTG